MGIARRITLLAVLPPAFLARLADVTIMLADTSVSTGIVGTLFHNLIMVADFLGNR